MLKDQDRGLVQVTSDTVVLISAVDYQGNMYMMNMFLEQCDTEFIHIGQHVATLQQMPS